MNYRFCDDITLEFKAGRVVNNDMTPILDKLLAAGYVELVPDEVYLRDSSSVAEYMEWRGVRLDKIATILEFRRAFDELGIEWSKYWRIEDFRAAAKKYMHHMRTYRTDIKQRQVGRSRNAKKRREDT